MATPLMMKQNQFDYNDVSFSCDESMNGSRQALSVDSFCTTTKSPLKKKTVKKDNAATNDTLVTAENKVISRIKYFLFAFLLVTAVVVGSVVYLLAKEADDYKLEEDFVEFADLFFQSVSSSLDMSLSSIDNYIVNLVSHAEVTNSIWPFVVLPHFSQKIRKIQKVARAAHLSQSHFVRNDQRLEWENFTSTNNQWV
jgi:hypothetical protein